MVSLDRILTALLNAVWQLVTSPVVQIAVAVPIVLVFIRNYLTFILSAVTEVNAPGGVSFKLDWEKTLGISSTSSIGTKPSQANEVSTLNPNEAKKRIAKLDRGAKDYLIRVHDHLIAKFISSQQMDNSAIQNRVINLGIALVEELGLDPGVATLSRWMAHYIAEQMTIVENATGNEKSEAEQRCFQTILEVWKHRASLPDGHCPFESFEAIFRSLARLDPENPSPYYYSQFHSGDSVELGEKGHEVQLWLDLAEGIDQAARICLEYIFLQAASKATDEKTITWLVNASDLAKGSDLSLILHLIYTDAENESEETAKQHLEARQKNLKSRIEKLDAFINFAQDLRTAFFVDLESISQSEPPVDETDTDLH